MTEPVNLETLIEQVEMTVNSELKQRGFVL
jgi:hypothetical protein